VRGAPHPALRSAVARDYAGFSDDEPAHWDRIAADGGYADQSHLIGDFREFTGGTPADFLARSIPAAPREPAQSG
jgi:AraC-like DNA-binding protein